MLLFGEDRLDHADKVELVSRIVLVILDQVGLERIPDPVRRVGLPVHPEHPLDKRDEDALRARYSFAELRGVLREIGAKDGGFELLEVGFGEHFVAGDLLDHGAVCRDLPDPFLDMLPVLRDVGVLLLAEHLDEFPHLDVVPHVDDDGLLRLFPHVGHQRRKLDEHPLRQLVGDR